MERIELLSPAGDLKRLKIALMYGADAVYIGGQEFSLRANATNFSIDAIREACDFAHARGKKVYLTLNIVFHNEDLPHVREYIEQVVSCGIDAFIVSDPFLISYIVEHFPNVEVHVSTQNSTCNYEAVSFFKRQGVKRVVVARELSKEEIQEIIAKTNVDIEVFIHGAMCTFYSGRCVLSNYVTNRDSNRGGCSQVCRFAFDQKENDAKFTMATKDLNLARCIPDMIEIGVRSLKVEGRMRSPYYLATVMSSYRRLIDAYYDGVLTEELIRREEKILSRVANRETSEHFFTHPADYTDQYYTGRQELSNQDYLAFISDYDPATGKITMIERNYFSVGDEVEIFTPSGEIYSLRVENLYDHNHQEITIARHPDETLYMYFKGDIAPYSMMRKKVLE